MGNRNSQERSIEQLGGWRSVWAVVASDFWGASSHEGTGPGTLRTLCLQSWAWIHTVIVAKSSKRSIRNCCCHVTHVHPNSRGAYREHRTAKYDYPVHCLLTCPLWCSMYIDLPSSWVGQIQDSSQEGEGLYWSTCRYPSLSRQKCQCRLT